VGIYDSSSQAITSITTEGTAIPAIVRFSGTASDTDVDVIYFKWDFTTPGDPTTFTLYGRDAYVDVANWPGSSQGVDYPTLGVVTAIDRYGVSSAQFAIPQLTVKT
jgi:hypothetical protein